MRSVENTTAALAKGGMVVLVDDRPGGHKGSLVTVAEHVTPHIVNFLTTRGRGLLRVPMRTERLEQLAIPPMPTRNSTSPTTDFHIGVDLVGSRTGISTTERAATIHALADPTSIKSDFTHPGQVFPLAYRAGGVLQRASHTEAAVDLVTMTGAAPAAVTCDIARTDGESAQLPDLVRFAGAHGLPIITIADIIQHRRRTELLVTRAAHARMPISDGEFTAVGYVDQADGREHLALVLGAVESTPGLLVAIHSECLPGIIGSLRCDCQHRLQVALRTIAAEGVGAVIFIRRGDSRGARLLNTIRTYQQQDTGFGTAGDRRESTDHSVHGECVVAGQILRDLDITDVRLLSDDPTERRNLEHDGIRVRPPTRPREPTGHRGTA